MHPNVAIVLPCAPSRSMIGAGAKASITERSLSILNVGSFRTCWKPAPPKRLRIGLSNILKSKSRPATAAVFTHRAFGRERRKLDKSLIAFICCQNLRESIERHMTRISRFAGRPQLPPTAGDRHAARRGECGHARQALFDRVSLLRASGKTFVDIAAQIGVDHRTVAKWIKTGFPLHRRRLALKPSSPLYFPTSSFPADGPRAIG